MAVKNLADLTEVSGSVSSTNMVAPKGLMSSGCPKHQAHRWYIHTGKISCTKIIVLKKYSKDESRGAEDVAQLVACLPSMDKALGFIPRTE